MDKALKHDIEVVNNMLRDKPSKQHKHSCPMCHNPTSSIRGRLGCKHCGWMSPF